MSALNWYQCHAKAMRNVDYIVMLLACYLIVECQNLKLGFIPSTFPADALVSGGCVGACYRISALSSRQVSG